MRQKMGVLGPVGTHSEAAARYLVEWQKLDREIVCYGDIGACLHAVETGAVDAAFVPVENSLEGAIAVTLDVLARSDVLRVQREVIWPVHNYLMARRADVEIRTIYSHAQPIAQCGDFLLRRYSQAELIKTASTARAAEMVGALPVDAGAAAICTRRAGALHGLVEIAGRIEDSGANCTRFFLVERAGKKPPALRFSNEPVPEKLLVICQIDGKRAGSLCEVLQEFAVRGVNMLRIESRPARTELGAYIFFFELEADAVGLAASVEAVRQKSIWLRTLGAFPVLTAANLKGASLWSSL